MRVILASLFGRGIGATRIELSPSLTTKKERLEFFPASERAQQKAWRSLFKRVRREL